MNDGEEKTICDLIKDEDFDSYGFLGKIKSGSEIHLEVKISKEDYNKDITLNYCAMDEISISSVWDCYWGRVYPICEKRRKKIIISFLLLLI